MLLFRKQRGKPVRIRHGRATVMDESAADVTGDPREGAAGDDPESGNLLARQQRYAHAELGKGGLFVLINTTPGQHWQGAVYF